jgi:hypothetical protein
MGRKKEMQKNATTSAERCLEKITLRCKLVFAVT